MVAEEASGAVADFLSLCISGGSITAGAARATEEGCRAERHVVPEPVARDGEPEKQADNCFCPVPVPGNTSDSKLTNSIPIEKSFPRPNNQLSAIGNLYFSNDVVGFKKESESDYCWYSLKRQVLIVVLLPEFSQKM